MTAAEKYANDVIKGKLPASKFVIQASKRFLSWLKRDDITYDIEKAEHVVDWFEKHLHHWEGEWRGKPFILEPWQKFILQQIFGLYRDGRRLITRAYIQVPRKNAKTTTVAGIALYHLFADAEQSPQILIGANSHEQASICSTCAMKIIQQSPNLIAHVQSGNIKLHTYSDSCKAIIYGPKDGKLIPMSKEIKTKDGFNPSLGLIDEYHEAPTSEFLNVVRSGQGARKNPLLIVITTAGFKKDGPCYSQLRRVGVDILKGKLIDDTQLALIYEPDDKDDWMDEKTWRKVNPNYGVSVFPHFLQESFNEARNEGATKERNFKTKNLNIWTDSSAAWISDEIWMQNNRPPITEGLLYQTGLDMAYKRDWVCWLVMGKDEDEYSVIPYFWIPEDTIETKLKNEHSNLLDWIEAGYVFTTPGNVTDHDAVSDFIINYPERIKSCYADPMHAVSTINKLNESGINAYDMPQTMKHLTPSINLMYELVKKGKLRHGGNPVLRWMLGNAVLVERSNLLRIEKENENGKIDGIAAMLNAFVPFVEEKEERKTIVELWS